LTATPHWRFEYVCSAHLVNCAFGLTRCAFDQVINFAAFDELRNIWSVAQRTCNRVMVKVMARVRVRVRVVVVRVRVRVMVRFSVPNSYTNYWPNKLPLLLVTWCETKYYANHQY